jgi:hypothetical protein
MIYRNPEREQKRHAECITPHIIEYSDPRALENFCEFDLHVHDEIYRNHMGWQFILLISDDGFSKLSQNELASRQTYILRRIEFKAPRLHSFILPEIRGYVKTTDFQEFASHVYRLALSALTEQIDSNGLSFYLETEEMAKDANMIPLIPKIMQLRKSEMDNCTVTKNESFYDLRALWLTHWGYSLLKASSKKIIANEKDILRIKDMFSSVGFELNIEEGDTTLIHVKMPEYLRNTIWTETSDYKRSIVKADKLFKISEG